MPFGRVNHQWMQQQRSPYDIRSAGDYGLNKFDPEETRRKQRQLYQQAIDEGMQSSRESALAGGSFNPELSQYNATKSARNAMFGADVDLDKYAHEDQYRLLNSLLGIDQSKLNREQLEFQKYAYEDSQPSWLEGLLDVGMGFAGSFLEEGGIIPDSNKFLYNYGGYIPPNEINSPPTINQPTNDNTLIKAKTGESILNETATNLFGADTVKTINETAQQFLQGGGGVMPQKPMPTNSMGNSRGNMGWFDPYSNTTQNIGGLIGYATQKIPNMFGGAGAVGATAMQDGGVVGDDDDRILYDNPLVKEDADVIEAKRNIDLLWNNLKYATEQHPDYPKLLQRYENAKNYLRGITISKIREMQKDQYNLYNQNNQPNLQTQPPNYQRNVQTQPDNYQQGGTINQQGNQQQEQTITIKRKPVLPKTDTGIYAGTGNMRTF